VAALAAQFKASHAEVAQLAGRLAKMELVDLA